MSSKGGKRQPEKGDFKAMQQQEWREDLQAKGKYVSEKYNGIRGLWDGEKLRTHRRGIQINPPTGFTEHWPDFPMDGELYIQGASLGEHNSTIRSYEGDWSNVKFKLFDLPTLDEPFENRYEFMKEHLSSITNIEVVEQIQCKDEDHLKEIFEDVVARGGEGVVIRVADSAYVSGRSGSAKSSLIWKLKPEYDAEAKVIGYNRKKGARPGAVGSLLCVLPDDTEFSVSGLTDTERIAAPDVNTIITFKYMDVSEDGVPLSPTLVCDRTDLTWEQVQEDFVERGGLTRRRTDESAARRVSTGSVKSVADVRQSPTAKKADEMGVVDGVLQGVKYLLMVNPSTNNYKFWGGKTEGATLITHHGRIGTDGRVIPKDFDSEEKAQKELEKKWRSKVNKGYNEPETYPTCEECKRYDI
ncbi:MAG: DNA ligase [Candidatus Thorarchaeota archaeon]